MLRAAQPRLRASGGSGRRGIVDAGEAHRRVGLTPQAAHAAVEAKRTVGVGHTVVEVIEAGDLHGRTLRDIGPSPLMDVRADDRVDRCRPRRVGRRA
jgi:hypothetical protein